MIPDELLEKVRKDRERVSRLEEYIFENPDDRAAKSSLLSLRKRLGQFEREVAEFAKANFIDFVNYRIINTNARYSINTIAESLIGFQQGFTAAYDAKKHGAKERARYSEETLSRTELSIESTYQGSFGFVLYITDERSLFAGEFDETVEAIGDFLEIESANEAIDCTRQLGLAATSRLYRWVAANFRSGNSVDYQWRQSTGTFKGQLVPVERFHKLKDIFESAVDLEREQLQLEGTLVGLDTARETFHFVLDDGSNYFGQISPEISTDPHLVPRRYVAHILSEATLIPATGERKEQYTLLALT
ncbi:hypothetical protein [Rhodosalinus halophilus]|uniref:hypothetical protein n=1 Tax=Rhodosalinus halophilus TaxID=2259333 RepID=UPI0011BF80EE|nr:hypothetical protein [Rhodosalinus halophilus]